MAITKLSDSSITTGDKYISMLAGNSAYIPPSYESIATVTVGSGGAANVAFTSIPATYTHLQIRGIGRTSDANTGGNLATYIRINSDTGNNYAFHQLSGSGTSAGASSGTSQNLIYTIHAGPRGNDLSNTFSAQIIDILDYTNTNKICTVRSLRGQEQNGSGSIGLHSYLYNSTTAISRLDFVGGGGDIVQYSSFALYGIKEA